MLGFDFKEVKCVSCGTRYVTPTALHDAKLATRNDDTPIASYCPYGHQMVYKPQRQMNIDEQTKLERDRLKQDAARLEEEINLQRELRKAAERSAIAFKASATRVKNRAKAGVCPCCNRTFSQLQRHMKRKHPHFNPEFDPADEAKKVRSVQWPAKPRSRRRIGLSAAFPSSRARRKRSERILVCNKADYIRCGLYRIFISMPLAWRSVGVTPCWRDSRSRRNIIGRHFYCVAL